LKEPKNAWKSAPVAWLAHNPEVASFADCDAETCHDYWNVPQPGEDVDGVLGGVTNDLGTALWCRRDNQFVIVSSLDRPPLFHPFRWDAFLGDVRDVGERFRFAQRAIEPELMGRYRGLPKE